VSVVYGTTENVAGTAIRNFWIGPSLSNRIGRIRIESRSFASPYSTLTKMSNFYGSFFTSI